MAIKKYYNYCFTLNNYTSEEEAHFMTFNGHKQVKYCIFGHEIGEETHTPHLQGYIMFHSQKTPQQTKKFLGPRVHFEKANGTPVQNSAYCGKDEHYLEFGDKPTGGRSGQRTDISTVAARIQNNDNIYNIIMEATSYQAARHAELLMKYQQPPPAQKRIIKWFYGSSGTGKTRDAINTSETYYITMNTLKWWDGYIGQETIIIDDFRKDFCTYHELLRILDRYPYRVNTKGSSIWFQSTTKNIIITSAYHPSKVYDTREDIEQLLRRIDVIKNYDEDVQNLFNY